MKKYLPLRLALLSSLLMGAMACNTNQSVGKAVQRNANKNKPNKILVFSKTKGFRHNSIPNGILAIKKLANQNQIVAVATEDVAHIHTDSLKNYRAVVFLSTTGDILQEKEEQALKNYIETGGGLVGIHAAADCEYDWTWYGNAIGGYFLSHPKVQPAKILVLDKKHPSTAHLPSEWVRTDEWYDYKNFNPSVSVLMKLDESSYTGGKMKGDHPIAWYHQVEKGRVWYTGLGHTKESFEEEAFLQHIWGGISYAMGVKSKKVVQP